MSATQIPNQVKIIECPRDAWQGLAKQIPTRAKVEYLRAQIAAGFRQIDAVSFVSPKAVPQMADSEEVLLRLQPPADVEIIGVVLNRKGAERAIATRAVRTLGFPYSVSPTFAMRNQRQTPEQSRAELREIGNMAGAAGVHVIAYASMAFGNPYGDAWDPDTVLGAILDIEQTGVRVISLADTVGLATSEEVADLLDKVNARFPHLEVGVHLHSRPDQAAAKVLAAYDAGCRRFDSALGGLGGCPFAQDEKVGNLPTEAVLSALAKRGVRLPLEALEPLISQTARIAADFA
jgi:hydroxymethylglutaryl-CoA lyase